MTPFPRALPFPLPVPPRLALVALLALLRQAKTYTEPPIPDGCIAEIAEVDREAMRAVYAALPERLLFWHDGIPQYKLFDDSHNVSYCCVAPKPAGVSCYLWCPLECTPAGRITRIYSEPSREDMPVQSGSGGSCPPGALSPAIGNLAELSSLVFRHSCLTGDLPDSVTRLQKLTEFQLPENNFSGPIPPGLFRLPALGHVDLCMISPYPYFEVESEGLSGSLPNGLDVYSPSLETVILITALILRNNGLSGAIPPPLAEMSALQNLDLGENRLSGAVPAALRDSESLKALDEVRLDDNALTGPFCDALLPARELWLGFNDLGGSTARSSASATGGGGGGGGGEEEEEGGSLHGWPSMGGLGRIIQIDLSHNSLSGNLKAFTVLSSGSLDLSHNFFFGGIPETFFSGVFSCADLRLNELSRPLFDTRREACNYDWDVLRVSGNNARMAGTESAGYLPVPAPGVHTSAAETEALLAVRDALLGEAAEGTVLADGESSSWAEILHSWVASSSSACAWYGVGCTADGHVHTLHLIGNTYDFLHHDVVPKTPPCEYDQYGFKTCGHADMAPLCKLRFFLRGLPGGSSNSNASGSLSEALGQLTHLTSLRISGYVLSGGLPPSLSRLSRLVALDLSSNRHLSGSIPPALFTLPWLRELTLRENNLTGEVLPTTTAAAASAAAALSPSLESLDGDVSALAAAFPPPAAAAAASSAPVLWGLRGVFPLLTRVHVSSNEVSGDAAGLFPLSQGLLMLNLSNKRLTWGPGSNASWHGYCLDLSHNRIITPLQDLFGNDDGLWSTVLLLSHNQLSGPIPATLLRDKVQGHLDLSHNLLTGSIPAIDNLYSMKTLDLSYNQLSGTIPKLDGSLITCDLSHNQLSGKVPPAPPALMHLNVSWNQLDGFARWQYQEGTGLRILDASHNAMAGNLPDLGNSDGLMSLNHLDLSYNAFTGTLAEKTYPFLEQATSSTGSVQSRCGVVVRLSHNRLTGSIPTFVFSSCPILIDLSHNQFSGPIPVPPQGNSQSFSLEFFSHLDLSSNKLTGSISDALVTGLTALSHLDLSDNLLSGSLPCSLAAVPPLTHLDLSRNKLKGSLPAFCQGKQRLASLLLSSNAFSGPLSSLLPSSSSCASSLLSLNVSTNQLSGSLPSSLSRFTALHSLLAARNRMSDSIPVGLASLKALQELDMSWSGLSGTIPALLRAAAPSLQVHLAGNALSGSVAPLSLRPAHLLLPPRQPQALWEAPA
ncbi:unnamed protein product [Closterium sp. NIES-65]|nr:unnamed protein product [Closterium sp. NIES-65]